MLDTPNLKKGILLIQLTALWEKSARCTLSRKNADVITLWWIYQAWRGISIKNLLIHSEQRLVNR